MAHLSNDAILARIFAQYGVYVMLPAFREGYRAYQTDGACRRNPYEDAVPGENPAVTQKRQVNGQAWDRGANAAMLYQRALAHLDAQFEHNETAEPGWLEKLIRTGGRA